MGKITRRDFINGTLLAAGATMLPFGCASDAVVNSLNPLYYPPSLTGLRGSHIGSNTHSHARAWTGKSDWGKTTELEEEYDLVVVGGGISGLAAAYFYQQKHGMDKKILILDNHDDFGGHAKRNEHMIDGKMVLGHGGSQSIVGPKRGSDTVHALLKDIGVDISKFDDGAYDKDFFKRNDLMAVTYFNKETFGEDKVVSHPYCNYPNYIEGIVMGGKLTNEEAAEQAPLSESGKAQLLNVLNGGFHKIDLPKEELRAYVRKTPYYDYLKNDLGVEDPLIYKMARNTALDWATKGTDCSNIRGAKSAGAMGFEPKAVYDEETPYIYHFPDGNAGVARAMVKKMIPAIAEGNGAEELVLAVFKYAELDKPTNAVRIRLSSTVVNVEHVGDAKDADEVVVNYINEDKSYKVKAKNVVMACYNMMIPHIVTGLPEEQHAALRLQTKCPLVYTTVGLRNWKAIKKLGMGMAMSPGNWHQAVLMDFPVSIGGYEYTKTPDDPCVIQMISCPYGTEGTPARDQFKEARYEMLGREFADYEKEIRSHLTGMFPKDLFDFDRDVTSITVNRWGHGYTVGGPDDSTKIGRQPFGRITIANCDSAPGADAKTAIDMAARAVKELG
ncbi:MAG: NAD(P)/FAD-dependent oxidoreductase [Flavobacteriales bacterium]|nr:NAD(P)/FAD-dependent oxidoreductase [Flavobacteriales bacterium]